MCSHITNDDWLSCSQMVIPYQFQPGCEMDALSERLFVFGGYLEQNQTHLDKIEEYNVSANNWTLLPPNITLIQPMYRVSCILFSSYDNLIYCVGGRNEFGSFPTIHIFNPMTLTIDAKKFAMSISRRDVRVLQYKGCLLFLGGTGGEDIGRIDIIEYDTALFYTFKK